MDWLIYLNGFAVMLVLATVTWLLSLYLRDVSIVDSAWSIMFLGAAYIYFTQSPLTELRETIVFLLVLIWALRLSAHLTWRNWGEPEDRRYQAIREKYVPNFAIKSLFIIFIFQAVIAWVVSLSLVTAFQRPALVTGISLLDIMGILLWLTGMLFESIADWQLAKFKNNPENQGKVMQTGLWKFSRHPNYFGECLIWWGFYLFALNNGAWWSIVSPLIMTWLLLKFSGVVMLEQTITTRRPDYLQYQKRTNAFFPGLPKKIVTEQYPKGHTS